MKYVALILAALLALSVFYPRKPIEDGAALRAATQAREIDRARAAEQTVKATAEADSLKATLAAYKQRTRVVVRHDTAFVPIQEFVYLTDTLIPRCELCALRTDSLVAAMQAQVQASDHVENLLRGEVKGLRKTNGRWQRLAPLIYVAGVATGSLFK